MKEYHVVQTDKEASECMAAQDELIGCPIVGNCNGKPAPQNQQTTGWAKAPTKMQSGDLAVPRIPKAKLDFRKVSSAKRGAFTKKFGQARELTVKDFPEVAVDMQNAAS